MMALHPDPPALPVLANDLYLEVFTHRSIRHEKYKPLTEFGDGGRLAVMGEEAIRYAVAGDCFHSDDTPSGKDIKVS